MTHLGALGTTPGVPVEVTFDYFDKTGLRVNPTLSELDYVDFLDTAGKIDVNDPTAVGMVKDFARMCLHPEDFDGFWSTAKANRQDMAAVFGVLEAIIEATSDRPTVRPSSSSGTPTSDGTSSAPPVLRLLEGRPDLQRIAQLSLEAQAAAAG